MKKFLLSMAIVASGISVATAKDYVILGADAPELTWTATETGFQTVATVDGAKFTLTMNQAESSNTLMDPATTNNVIRVYKSSEFTIESEGVTMKQITLTSNSKSHCGEQTVSEGWTQVADGLVLTITSAGSKSMTMTASNNQFRIAELVVSDEVSGSTEPSEPTDPEVTVVNSVAETIALDSDSQVTVNYPMTVAFVNNRNIFATDNAGGFIQIYGNNTYAVNDVIPAGWMGTYKLYNGNTPEIMPEGELPAATDQKTFEPKAVSAAEISTALVNNVVLLKNVEFAEATPDSKSNFSGVCDGMELSFRNNYSLAGVPAGKYDVTIVVTVYNNAPSLYVVNYAQAGSGVESVEAASEEAVYYNLNGVPVATPEKGLFIRMEGNKATKVIF